MWCGPRLRPNFQSLATPELKGILMTPFRFQILKSGVLVLPMCVGLLFTPLRLCKKRSINFIPQRETKKTGQMRRGGKNERPGEIERGGRGCRDQSMIDDGVDRALKFTSKKKNNNGGGRGYRRKALKRKEKEYQSTLAALNGPAGRRRRRRFFLCVSKL